MRFVVGVAVVVVAWLATEPATAQQVTVSTPMRSVGDSFYEQMGVNWGFNWKGGGVSFGGPNMAAPPFGGFDPNAGLRGGFALGGSKGSGYLNFAAGQGYRQNFVSQAPSVTLSNGRPGFFSDTSQSPFVIGHIPIVGGFPVVPYRGAITPYPGFSTFNPAGMLPVLNPHNAPVQALQQRLARGEQAEHVDSKPLGPGGAARRVSSADRAVPSVAEARRLHAGEQAAGNKEAMVLFERGRTAEEDGKPNVAKVYYRMAVKRATGQSREQIQARLNAINSSAGQ